MKIKKNNKLFHLYLSKVQICNMFLPAIVTPTCELGYYILFTTKVATLFTQGYLQGDVACFWFCYFFLFELFKSFVSNIERVRKALKLT